MLETGIENRHEALAKGRARYFDGKPCKHGHLGPRYSKRGDCVECRNLVVKRWYSRNAKIQIGNVRKRQLLNPEKTKAIGRHKAALRRAREMQATPKWVDMAALREIYAKCPNGYEVDHIAPLAGRRSCGLHVPWNLQYLTRSENARKSNRDG